MKKLFLLGAVFFGVLLSQNGYSADNAESAPASGPAQVVYGGECPADQACGDQSTGECWCLCVHYEPCYYTTRRCVEEQVPCTKRCCRYVPKYYEVQRCRYVPQYYCEQVCRNEPEYYDVCEYKTCKKYVCDKQCKYVPKYYWKHSCGTQTALSSCPTPCPSN